MVESRQVCSALLNSLKPATMDFDQQGSFSKYIQLIFLEKHLPAVLETAFQNYYYLPFVIKCHSVGSMAHPYDVLKLTCTY